MNAKSVLADFQFQGNRVSKFALDTRLVKEKGKTEVTIDFDYKVNEVEMKENKFWATLCLIILVKAKIKKKILFSVELKMEGLFTGDAEKITQEKFVNMLEINGLVTLLHLSRAYLLSVTSQSGIQPPVKIPMINVLKLREEKARQRQEKKIRTGITSD
jgi:preprotein translocase subunit SecB